MGRGGVEVEGKQRGRQRVEAIRGSGRDDSELEGKREGGTVEGKGGGIVEGKREVREMIVKWRKKVEGV